MCSICEGGPKCRLQTSKEEHTHLYWKLQGKKTRDRHFMLVSKRINLTIIESIGRERSRSELQLKLVKIYFFQTYLSLTHFNFLGYF